MEKITQDHVAALRRAICAIKGNGDGIIVSWQSNLELAQFDSQCLSEVAEWLDGALERPQPPAPTETAKQEHWRIWGIAGMPKDKIKLADETWKAAMSASKRRFAPKVGAYDEVFNKGLAALSRNGSETQGAS